MTLYLHCLIQSLCIIHEWLDHLTGDSKIVGNFCALLNQYRVDAIQYLPAKFHIRYPSISGVRWNVFLPILSRILYLVIPTLQCNSNNFKIIETPQIRVEFQVQYLLQFMQHSNPAFRGCRGSCTFQCISQKVNHFYSLELLIQR